MKNLKKTIPIIENEKIYLRRLNKKDFLQCFENRSDINDYNSLPGYPPTKEKFKKLFKKLLKDKYCFAIVEKTNNIVVGNISIENYLSHHNWCEIGYFVASRYKGNRYATQSLILMSEFVQEKLNINTISLIIWETNISSQKVAKNAWFECCGKIPEARLKNEKYVDILQFYLIKKNI